MQKTPASGSLKELVHKVNSDRAFRALFLSDPTEILQEYGISLSTQAQKELKDLIEEYRAKIPGINNVPSTEDAEIVLRL